MISGSYNEIVVGIFLAAKAYTYRDGNSVTKFKGPTKDHVSPEWFEKQLADPRRKIRVKVDNKFRINWEELAVCRKETYFNLGIKPSTKRITEDDDSTTPYDIEERAPPTICID